MMTRIFKAAAAVAAGVVLFSCSGNSGEEDGQVILEADKTSIVGNGTDAVTFTVRYGSADVTSEAEIICENDGSVLDEPVFASAAAGPYSFKAIYQEMESASVPVTVIEDTQDVPDEPDEPDDEPWSGLDQSRPVGEESLRRSKDLRKGQCHRFQRRQDVYLYSGLLRPSDLTGCRLCLYLPE